MNTVMLIIFLLGQSKHRNVFSKGCTDNWSKEIFLIDSVLKTNPWNCKIKDSIGELVIRTFHEKKLLLSKSQINYYPEPDILEVKSNYY